MRTLKVALHQMNYTTGDFRGNFERTKASILGQPDADLHALPECAVANYAAGDYLLEADYQRAIVHWTEQYRLLSEQTGTAIAVGTPLRGKVQGRKMGNGLVVFDRGRAVLSQFKTHLPNYDVFDDVRWFEARGNRRAPMPKWACCGSRRPAAPSPWASASVRTSGSTMSPMT
ncbi:nitrilase-related carbon-nitrogen hydrolase [Nitrospirillum sp. BR 11163]|uniref:nitrilase-related carbon-nitrogen hydrolase n=1 Tax=Nitrospirillum sp. BR 11163 TaxID=3104323 RepID=UPI002AFE6561|nr:nitrilase-related carbon-nitrogen hydrolase [Nitrospirillum sp. BR 11163]MEA1675170.1 nitrilase-related carbon-nitrogen hydrolase [Nitrospirillum sp. BR 11163]